MLKTMRIDLHYQVTVPAYVSYDDDFVPYDGISYMVLCESEDNRFFRDNTESTLELLKKQPWITDAKYIDDGCDDSEDVDYDPSVPMWTDYMSAATLREERESELRKQLDYALDDRDLEEIIRIAQELGELLG